MFWLPLAGVTGFSPARPWTLGYGDKPRIPLVADIEGNGSAAIVSVNPEGNGFIDVELSSTGLKGSGAFNALADFGKDCQAATAGALPGDSRATVFGLFGGNLVRSAGNFEKGHFQKVGDLAKLPSPVPHPLMALTADGKSIFVFSQDSGAGYLIDSQTKAFKPQSFPRGLTWMGDEGDNYVGQKKDGAIYWIDKKTLRLKSKLGTENKDSRPAVASGLVAFDGQVWTPNGGLKLTAEPYPFAPTLYGIGGSVRPSLFEFRQGNDYHKGGLVMMRRAELAEDATRSIPYEGSEAYWRDSSNDGLLDGWKTQGFRGLDMKKMGCTPGHADVICLVSPFDDVDKAFVESDMKKIIQFYADLKVPNPDGTTGIRFHPIYLDPIAGNDKNNPWWVNRDKFLPAKWKGVVHWMQITRGGGGQADELADGGTCGTGALWAVFVHEFGHQLGLNHEGFWPVGASPIYTSLMNYTWSYSFEETRDKIHYSDGRFSGLVLHEDDLDETLPFPYEKVKFLSMAPYHFRMKPDGDKTLIDWNWNGVFGEKHVKATINYAYSTTAGVRDTVTKTKTAPWIFVHNRQAFVLYGTNDLPVDLKVQPTLSATRPGRLLLKRMQKPTVWDKDWTIEPEGLIGDPVAASLGHKIACVYPTLTGLQMRMLEVDEKGAHPESPVSLSSDPTLVPTIGSFNGHCYVFDWNPKTHEVGYRTLDGNGKPSTRMVLDVPSSNPVGLCTDTLAHQAIIGLAQDQPKGKNNRWQIRRYTTDKTGALVAAGSPEWIEGESGGARGTGRVIVLFDSSRDAGPKGRVYLFGKGLTDDKNPWACSYVAQQIADKTYNGGWIVKRYYDEWSQTRSAPAAAWFGNDILFAYRWTAGDQSQTDNNLHLGYHGLGIETGAFGDFDDMGYIRGFGLANSILNLGTVP